MKNISSGKTVSEASKKCAVICFVLVAVLLSHNSVPVNPAPYKASETSVSEPSISAADTGTYKVCSADCSSDYASIDYTSIVQIYTFPAPIATRYNDFDCIDVDGLTRGGIPGCPLLPQKQINLLIPFGYRLSCVQAFGEPKTLEGKYMIKPAPRPVRIPSIESLSSEDTPPDSSEKTIFFGQSYSQDEFYPSELCTEKTVSSMRGFTVLQAQLHPVRYNPLTGIVVYYTRLEVTVTAEKLLGKDTTSTGTEYSGGLPSGNTYRGIPTDFLEIRELVDNPQTAKTYPHMQTPSAHYDLLIVTTSAMEAEFIRFANWKANLSISAHVVTVADITASTPGNDTQEKIRNYIRQEYLINGISYVLLGGDTGTFGVPHRGLYCYCDGVADNIPSDLYYGCLDGSWNNDGDTRFGEDGEEDWMAEVFVGRMPVETASEAKTVIDKVISFETHERSTSITLHGIYADGGVTTFKDTKEGCTKTGGIGCRDYVPSGYDIHTLYEPDNGTISKSRWTAEMTAGRLLINHGGHGLTDKYTASYYPTQVAFTSSDAYSLTNTYFPIQITVACLVGAFDVSDCLGEKFLLAPNGGCSACVMNSRYGLYGDVGDATAYSGEMDIELFKQIFANKIVYLGKGVQVARQEFSSRASSDEGYKWVIYCWNLLGDPTQDVLGSLRSLNIRLTSPVGSETLESGAHHNITWVTFGGNGTVTVDIDYSTTGCGGPWVSVARGEVDDGMYEWTVPNTPSGNCYVRVTAKDSSTPPEIASNMSASQFTITAPHIPERYGLVIFLLTAAVFNSALSISALSIRRSPLATLAVHLSQPEPPLEENHRRFIRRGE